MAVETNFVSGSLVFWKFCCLGSWGGRWGVVSVFFGVSFLAFYVRGRRCEKSVRKRW